MPATATDRLAGLTTSVAVKPPCAAVSAFDLPLTGLFTVGNVALAEGDRVLVRAQTDASENGIYVASTSDWSRALDFDGARDVVTGTLIIVRNSFVDGSIYEVTTSGDIEIGSSPITFELHDDPAIVYAQTAGEIAAGNIPVNGHFPPGDLLRWVSNSNPGTTDTAFGFQKAIDSADLTYPKINFTDTCAISKPLLIRASSVEGLSFEGATRTVSIIEPAAVDIHQAPQNINALMINQCDNGHLQLRNLRFLAEVAYSGHILYCVEGGCADASGQALFSATFDNIWCSLSSQNVGYFRGGFSNLKSLNMVYESVKDACWILEGAGNGDLQYIGHQMFICFDNFIRASDAFDKSLIVIDNLTAYSHLRGRLIEINKGHVLKFSNITLEPDAANLGDCGVFKLTDCEIIEAVNITMAARSGVPAGAVGIELINGCSGKFTNCVFNATTGLKTSGTGNMDLMFVNCDFTDCLICWEMVAGNLGGTIRFLLCKLNNAQQDIIRQTAGTMGFDVEFIGGEIINAGLGGTAGFSNLNITPGGNWIFRGTKFGKNNVGAVAANWINASVGGGSIKFLQPNFIGTPPTAKTTGTLGVYFEYERGLATIASAATLTLPDTCDVFSITGTTNITTITATNNSGRKITLIFRGILTLTDGSNILIGGNYVTTADDTISLVCDGTNWYEGGARAVN